VYFTYFYHLDYLCAKHYQIWLRFDEVLTKTSWVIIWHTLYNTAAHYAAIHCPHQQIIGCAVQSADIPMPQSVTLGLHRVAASYY